MTIFGAMTAGVSGLSAQSQSMGMIADNIANVSTIGYKGVEARFSSLVTQQSINGAHSPGGVRSNRFQEVDQQGLLQTTTSVTDLAISGAGMFTVRESPNVGPGNEFRFTRDGSFITNKDGQLVTSTAGLFLQGLPISDTGQVPTLAFENLETVNIAGLSVTARPTTTMTVSANLPATAEVGDVHQVTVPLFDGQGTQLSIDYFFVKTANNTWGLTGVLEDPDATFSLEDTASADDLTKVKLRDETHFTFNTATGNHFGGIGAVSVSKTDGNTVVVQVPVGGENFESTFDVSAGNVLADETNFAYNVATTGVDGGITATPSVTLTAVNEYTISVGIGGTTYSQVVTTDGAAGNDLTGSTLTLTDATGAESITLDMLSGPYDLDAAAGTVQTQLNAAFNLLTFSTGSIPDGTAELNPGGTGDTLTLVAAGGQTLVLDIPATSLATYDLQSATDGAVLQTNLADALNGLLMIDNTVGLRMADLEFSANGLLKTLTPVAPFVSVDGATNDLVFHVDYDNDFTTDLEEDRKRITLSLSDPNGLEGMRQFAGDFFVAEAQQNGVRFGNFTGVEISEEGIVTALFDNGETKDIYQVPIAFFANFNGMEAKSGNAFQQTVVSGQAQLLQPSTSGAGSIVSSALETSTVDIAEEFTKMIVTQRAYSANARIITTADEMLEELVRI